MKLSTYKHLFGVNAGFNKVIRNLAALRKERAFQPREMDRFISLSKETRSAVNSHLASVLEQVETDEAGRRFGRRRARELQEE